VPNIPSVKRDWGELGFAENVYESAVNPHRDETQRSPGVPD
jgi:hypothetical protein